MKNSFNDIDNFLRDSFEDFTSDPAPELRAKVSASVRKFNFFRFNPWSFNIFYLAAFFVGTSVILSFTTGVFTSDSNENSNRERKTQKQYSIENESDSKIDSPEVKDSKEFVKTDEKLIDENSYASHNKIGKENNQDDVNTPDTIIVIENGETLSSENGEDVIEKQENKIVYDTIVETVKIIVTDTVNNKVHQTVEIKKNKKTKN